MLPDDLKRAWSPLVLVRSTAELPGLVLHPNHLQSLDELMLPFERYPGGSLQRMDQQNQASSIDGFHVRFCSPETLHDTPKQTVILDALVPRADNDVKPWATKQDALQHVQGRFSDTQGILHFSWMGLV
jgi:hypothetical protein